MNMKESVKNYLIEQLASDDPALLAEVYGEFLRGFQKNLSAAHDALNTGDFAALTHAAHTLKGDAAIVGENRLRELALGLEQKAKLNDSAGCRPVFAELKKEFSVCR